MASLFFYTTLVFFSLCFLSNAKQSKLSFSVDLIHRDSPKSPFYNPTETPTQRFRNAIQRSTNRVQHYKQIRFLFKDGVDNLQTDSYYKKAKNATLNSIQSDVTSDLGEYLMNLSLGTPSFPIMAYLDTGSDLIWTQCEPCLNCYQQNAPLFSPIHSSTYKNFDCYSTTCTSLGTSCSAKDNTCSYSASYNDKSFSRGNIAAETLTLGSTDNRPTQLKNIIIGCGHENGGTFNKKTSGIVGLGGGSVSLISQLGDSIEGKFSYCLVPLNSADSSKLNFGEAAIVEDGAVFTPLIQQSQGVYYLVTLEAISVGGTRIPFTRKSNFGEGNLIVDSGTTFTMLPTEIYSQFEDVLTSAIQFQRRQNPEAGLSLCYSAYDNIKIPSIVMNFDGADVTLDLINVFVRISEELVCFAFVANDEISIYGNVAQMNFLIGYDIVSKRLSFKKTNCALM